MARARGGTIVVRGSEGRGVSFRVEEGWVEIKYTDEQNWSQFYKIPEGTPGKSVELRVNAGWVEWRQTGEQWSQLFKIPVDGSDASVTYANVTSALGFIPIDEDRFKVVEELPVSPVAGVFYFIEEEE